MEFLTWWFDSHWVLSLLFSFPMAMLWHYFYGHTPQLLAGLSLLILNICLKFLSFGVKIGQTK